MKMSLNLKLFLTVTLILGLFVSTMILLNSSVLEHYYHYQKELSLKKIYDEALTYFTSSDTTSYADLIFELQIMDSTKNIEVVICDLDSNSIFSSSNNFIKNGFFLPRSFGEGDINEFSFDDIKDSFTDESPYFIKIFHDRKMNSDYITFYGKLNESNIIILRTPLESIKESVSISNQFLIFVGIICAIISSIITFFASKAFTYPIYELNDIAQKMANLDFSKKYNIKTDDEIGDLGASINKLSTNLEKTIQDLKTANMELEKDVEETSKISEMRNQFISDVSHELKTPIALIQGYAEGLNDGIVQDEESKKYYIEVILDEANKMSTLTHDLLDLSRLEYGKEKLNFEDFNITELIKETFKKNELIFEEKQIKYEIDIDKSYSVNADYTRIEQVLTNYISNAIKHASGDKTIKCYIKETEDNKIRISIFNTGSHISDEDMPRLWTRFYKVDSSRNRSVGGTGIGLSLVKAIMTNHNCKYGVQNVENGVEFYFDLNLANNSK